MNKSERKQEVLAYEIADPMYPVEDGRTVVDYKFQYVPITSKPYPLKKKYR